MSEKCGENLKVQIDLAWASMYWAQNKNVLWNILTNSGFLYIYVGMEGLLAQWYKGHWVNL